MISMKSRWVAGVSLSLIAALAIGCSSDSDDDSSSSAAPTATTTAAAAPAATTAHADHAEGVAISLSEWSVASDVLETHPGEVTFSVTNDGATPHEFVVVKSDLGADALPVAVGAADELNLDVLGRTAQIDGGGSEELTLSLEAGSYVLLCNIPAHYGLGMRTGFTVE